MTREKQIIEAGIEYTMQNNPVCIGGDNFYEQAKEFNRNRSFEAGARWADTNLKSPWISVNDKLPCDDENLIHFGFTNKVLVADKNFSFLIAYMKKTSDNTWIWCSSPSLNITHWMYIPKL